MENPEEILSYLEEFTKLNSTHIPRELEEYLCFVAKTGDPVYQWPAIKTLFRQKLLNVITEFYETCPSVEIPPCPNVDLFNYDRMKNFILEKLDAFAAAPFTVQRICELLTAPRKEYNRIDKYMRALEKNILVVSTREPGNRGRSSAENGAEGIVNGSVDSEHGASGNSGSSDINVEVDMAEDTAAAAPWSKAAKAPYLYHLQPPMLVDAAQSFSSSLEPLMESQDMKTGENSEGCAASDGADPGRKSPEEPYVSIEPVTVSPNANPAPRESEIIVTITADPLVTVKAAESEVPSPAKTRRISEESVPDTETSPFVVRPTSRALDDLIPTFKGEDITEEEKSTPEVLHDIEKSVTSAASETTEAVSESEKPVTTSEPVLDAAVSSTDPEPEPEPEPKMQTESSTPSNTTPSLPVQQEPQDEMESQPEVTPEESTPDADAAEILSDPVPSADAEDSSNSGGGMSDEERAYIDGVAIEEQRDAAKAEIAAAAAAKETAAETDTIETEKEEVQQTDEPAVAAESECKAKVEEPSPVSGQEEEKESATMEVDEQLPDAGESSGGGGGDHASVDSSPSADSGNIE